MIDDQANVAAALPRSARGNIAAESSRTIRSPPQKAGRILDRYEGRWRGPDATTGTSPFCGSDRVSPAHRRTADHEHSAGPPASHRRHAGPAGGQQGCERQIHGLARAVASHRHGPTFAFARAEARRTSSRLQIRCGDLFGGRRETQATRSRLPRCCREREDRSGRTPSAAIRAVRQPDRLELTCEEEHEQHAD